MKFLAHLLNTTYMWNKEDQSWAVYGGWQCSPVYPEYPITLSFIFHSFHYGYHVRLLYHTHKHNF